jgi:hypothetical protein
MNVTPTLFGIFFGVTFVSCLMAYYRRPFWCLALLIALQYVMMKLIFAYGLIIIFYTLPYTILGYVFGTSLGLSLRQWTSGPPLTIQSAGPLWQGPVAAIISSFIFAYIGLLFVISLKHPSIASFLSTFPSPLSLKPTPPFGLPALAHKLLFSTLSGLFFFWLFGKLRGATAWFAWMFGVPAILVPFWRLMHTVFPSPPNPRAVRGQFLEVESIFVTSAFGLGMFAVLTLLAYATRHSPPPQASQPSRQPPIATQSTRTGFGKR